MSTAGPVDGSTEPLRLAAAGDAKPAWITLLTTEHYNLQTQRASTISETNGRASVFLGSVSSGLVALGFSGQDDRGSAGFVAFAVVVLTALVFLGVVTFARTVQTSIDDAVCALRIDALRDSYAQLVPELAAMLAVVRGGDAYQRRVGGRSRVQKMLTVAGSVGVVTSLLVGGDIGLLVSAVSGSLAAGLVVGVIAGSSPSRSTSPTRAASGGTRSAAPRPGSIRHERPRRWIPSSRSLTDSDLAALDRPFA